MNKQIEGFFRKNDEIEMKALEKMIREGGFKRFKAERKLLKKKFGKTDEEALKLMDEHYANDEEYKEWRSGIGKLKEEWNEDEA